MSRFKKLIDELCPNGVEFKKLWEVTYWDKKFNGISKDKQPKTISYKYYLSSEFDKVEDENGDIYYLSTGISGKDRYTTEEKAKEYVSEGEIVCIPWGGTPNVKYYKGKFVTGDNRIATSCDTTILNNKFLFYWLQNSIKELSSYYRGSGIKHPSMASVLDMDIAVPPLEVQHEIVHILDDFTLLSAELSAELKARNKQYEYYRNELLDNNNNNIKKIKVKDAFIRVKGTPITAAKMQEIKDENGDIKIFAGGKTVINTFEKNIPNANITKVPAVLVQSRGIIDVIYYDKPFTFKNEMWAYTHDSKITLKYLYYVLKNNIEEFRNSASGMGSMPQISLPVTEDFELSLPDLEEQERIVTILDSFEAICSDFKIGLPAEIEKRQQQYEYYRNLLLNFKEIGD